MHFRFSVFDVFPLSTLDLGDIVIETFICLITEAFAAQVTTTDSPPNGVRDLLKVNKRNPRILTVRRQPVGDLL
jgi:hypothetical protein